MPQRPVPTKRSASECLSPPAGRAICAMFKMAAPRGAGNTHIKLLGQDCVKSAAGSDARRR
jgi:hypothetical protein